MTQAQKCFEGFQRAGKQAVLLEGRWGEKGRSYVCLIDEKIKIPEGEAGFAFMRRHLRRHKMRGCRDGVFHKGFVGFVSYDLGEEWWIKMPNSKAQISNVPRARFVYVNKVEAFEAEENIPPPALHKKISNNFFPTANINKEEYFKNLELIRERLFAGDTYQVNFSQKFETDFSGDAWKVYCDVSNRNPSPFQVFFDAPQFALISNSPERLFMLNADRTIVTQPIKGTAPRGLTREEDDENEKRMLASEKEAAELAMIVDLGRNDLGKVCIPGSVHVVHPRAVERYSHVMHTVATVQGVLAQKYDWYDTLRALFPGGSVTGCPKKRTMEIIRELEDEPRGVYCGSAGYIDLSGSCDFNILIRTAWLDKTMQKITFRSGGGIVVDSDPLREYEETLHKAGAFMQTLV